jgi:hypothetical protein
MCARKIRLSNPSAPDQEAHFEELMRQLYGLYGDSDETAVAEIWVLAERS